jgi:hypothetical protein
MAFKIPDAAACREAVKDMERGWGEAIRQAASRQFKISAPRHGFGVDPRNRRLPPPATNSRHLRREQQRIQPTMTQFQNQPDHKTTIDSIARCLSFWTQIGKDNRSSSNCFLKL